MRLLFVIASLLLSTICSHSQTGQYLVAKADRMYSKGKFDKSLTYCNQAENADFGESPEANLKGQFQVWHLRSKNHIAMGNFDQALSNLDSISCWYESYLTDTTLAEIYNSMLGSKIKRNDIEQSFSSIRMDTIGFCQYLILPVQNSIELKFRLYPDWELIDPAEGSRFATYYTARIKEHRLYAWLIEDRE